MTSRIALVSLAAAAVTCVTLSASVIVPADLPTLVTEAQTIVHGRVTEARGVVRANRKRVDTYVVFEVASTLKGASQSSVVFRVLGGTSGRYTTIVPGSPSFTVGDEAVVFLGKAQGDAPFPVGLSHGVFRVRRDRGTGERAILPPPMLIDPNRSMTIRRGDGTRVPISVESFSSIVRGLAARRQP